MNNDRWTGPTIDSHYNGLRFFAQLCDELLYYFSHDSFKVPTLNFHFLCIECLAVLEKIDGDILDKGGIKPILLELIDAYKRDPIVCSFYGDDINIHFSAKDEDGVYKQSLKEIVQSSKTDISLQKIKRSLLFFQDDLARESRYVKECINQIRKLVIKKDLQHDELDMLQQYIKIFLTELINLGYSQEYLYNCVRNVFYTHEESITAVEECFDKFISCFPMQKKEYAVYLPLNNVKIKNELSNFRGFYIAENVYEMFEVPSQYVIKVVDKAMDPEEAKNSAISLIEFCLSLSQYCQHTKKSCSFKVAEVVDVKTKECVCLKTLAQPINRQIRHPMDAQDLLKACFQMNSGVFNAVCLHTSAFETKELKNQLLNLWTAMEVLIPVERSGSFSRINQISNAVSTMLTSRYFRSLLFQLDQQIADAIKLKYDEIIERVDVGNSRIEKLLALLVLPKYNIDYNELCQDLICAPVLSFRLKQYQDIFMSGKKIKDFYQRHSMRLTWQMMRIYRNRNMIVHDGDTFPFLNLILQNLHFYIDEIIDIFCEKNKEGFVEASSIIMQLAQREQKYLAGIDSAPSFDERNYVRLILG